MIHIGPSDKREKMDLRVNAPEQDKFLRISDFGNLRRVRRSTERTFSISEACYDQDTTLEEPWKRQRVQYFVRSNAITKT
jgi:hypothetical protein